MNEQTQLVAARIRELRELAGTSIEKVAANLGVPVVTYSDFESGKIDIPVGVLSEVARCFHVELGTLLTGGDPKLHVYAVTRRGKGPAVERRSRYRYRALADNFVQKQAEPFEVTVAPDPDDLPYTLNSHPGQEFDLVLEGTLRISIGGHELVLNEGDSVYYDSTHPHGMKAGGNALVRFLAVIL